MSEKSSHLPLEMASSSSQVTDILLKKNILQCAICNNLLLGTSVMLVEGIGNVCTACFQENYQNEPDSKWLQNTALEELVTTLSYPCRFRENGCEQWTSAAELLNHEDSCRFRSQKCPMNTVNQCLWEGFPTEFVGHFLNCHGEHVINFENNLFYLDISITEEEIIKLLVMKNIILLLKMRLSIEFNKLLYVVCNVKDDGSSSFDYSVKHKGNSESYIKTRSRVVDCNYIYKDLDETVAVSVDLQSLQQTVKVTNRITNIFKIKTYDAPAHYLEDRMLHFFECPVCKCFMKPPIYQCQSGHSVCNVCKPRLEKCPTCRAPFGMTRNYSLEGLTAGISYPCAYHDLGCLMSLSPVEITRHEAVCPYKPYRCPLQHCTMTGSHDVIINHLTEVHAEHVFNTNHQDTHGYQNSFRLEQLIGSPVERKILLAHDRIFRLSVKKEYDHCMWAAEAIGAQNDVKNFVYEVSIIDVTKPEKRLIRTDYCLNEMPEDDLFKRCILFQNCLLATYSHNGVVSFQFIIRKMT